MRCFLLAFLALPAAFSQSVKSCGGPNDHLKNPVIKLTPDPPVKGGTLTIQASGTLDEVEGSFNSNVDLSIKALGIITATVKGGVPMSISPGAVSGPFSLTVGPFSLPSNVPGSAVVKGQVHVTNGKNEPILCIDLDLDVPASEESRALTQDVAKPLDTYTCNVCAHVYDPVKDGAGKAFEDLPDTWLCPVCGAPKSAYTKGAKAPVVQKVAEPLDTYTCNVCAHVYDPVADGAGKAFEDLPDTWLCPVCGAPKSAYTKSVKAPTLKTISSCGKSTDHIPDFQVASSGGVITMSGTLDESVTKASIELDVSLKVLIISLPLKMSIPLAVSDGLISKGAIKSTVGPSTIAVSPDVKATVQGTMKINDASGQEITCLNVDTIVANQAAIIV